MARHEAVPASETSALEWQHLDAMLDEAGRQSFPASDTPAIIIDDHPLTTSEADEADADRQRRADRSDASG